MANKTTNRRTTGRKKYNLFVKIVAIVCAALMVGSVLLTVITSF